MIISAMNQKGGTGKTTILWQLYGIITQQKHGVVMHDHDPQQSLSSIYARSEYAKIAISNDPEFSLYDLPPGDAKKCREAMVFSDSVIVPVLPSIIDIQSSEALMQMFTEAKQFNRKLKIIWVINAARTGSNILELTFQTLEKLKLPYFPEAIPHSVAIAESISLAIPICIYKPKHPIISVYKKLLQVL